MHFRRFLRKKIIKARKLSRCLNPLFWKKQWTNSEPEYYIEKQVQLLNLLTPTGSILQLGSSAKDPDSNISYISKASRYIWCFMLAQLIISGVGAYHVASQSNMKTDPGSVVFQAMILLCFSSCLILDQVMLKKHGEVVHILNLVSGSQESGFRVPNSNMLKFVLANGPLSVLAVSGLLSIHLVMYFSPISCWWKWPIVVCIVLVLAWQNALAGLLVLQAKFASYIIISELAEKLLVETKRIPTGESIRKYRRLQVFANSVNACSGGNLSTVILMDVMSVVIVMTVLLVLPILRETSPMIVLFVATYLVTAMLGIITIGYGYPGKCFATSAKIQQAWKRPGIRMQGSGTWKLDERLIKSCPRLKIFVGNLDHFKQQTVVNLLDFGCNWAFTFSMVMKDLLTN